MRPEDPTSVYLDTNALITHISRRPGFEALTEIMQLIDTGKVTGVISTLSYTEMRGYSNDEPFPAERDAAALELLDHPKLVRVEFSRRVALRARRYAHQFRMSNPDAIHVASAVEAGVEVFITSDHGLHRGGRRIEGVWLTEPYEPGGPALFTAAAVVERPPRPHRL